jgi:5-methylcytosine-specific restriction endonuclease McrA
MVRRSISPATKAAILQRQGWGCSECGTKTGPFEYDHVKPLWLGGKDHPDNLTAKCSPCHQKKTVVEASRRAKMKRIKEQKGLLKKKLNQKEKFLRARRHRYDF